MTKRSRIAALVAIVVLTDQRVAHAGMPMVTISDIAQMRLEAISFFLGCFLVSSALVWKIWNAARNDFPRLPYLTYWRATGLVALWGLLFLLVLTMISGARELMTPGAWHKQGFTYKLVENDAVAKAAASQHDQVRRQALDRLRAALWTYARHHDGKFPASSAPPEIPDETWLVPEPSGMRFFYNGGLIADQGRKPLAYEPGIFGKERFVLFSSGEIARLSEDELCATLPER
jgi:hypothetical protein